MPYQRNNIAILISLISLLLFINLFDVAHCEKEIPKTKLGQNLGSATSPTMTFLYCYSCGYRKAFEDYVGIINEKYPFISIQGGNYDPPGGLNYYFSKSIFAIKILLIVLVVSQFDLFGALGQEIPAWWRFCVENKFFSCLMIFFIGNIFEAQLIASGAFEIALNDVPVWSKLQTGRIPQPQELFQIIDSHLQFNNPNPDRLSDNPDFVK